MIIKIRQYLRKLLPAFLLERKVNSLEKDEYEGHPLMDIWNCVFDVVQREQIKYGYQHGLSKKQIKLYANHRYSAQQMEQIRIGLEKGLDVSCFLNRTLSSQQIEEILSKLQ